MQLSAPSAPMVRPDVQSARLTLDSFRSHLEHTMAHIFRAKKLSCWLSVSGEKLLFR